MKLWRSSTGSPPPAASPSAESSQPNLESGWSLRLRLLITVTIALFPIAIASIVQGLDRARSDEAEVHDRLVQTTHAASGAEGNLLASAEQILRALGNLPDVRDAGSDCNQDLSAALRGLSFFTNIARIDANGAVICAALPAAVGHDASTEPVWKAARASDGFVVSGQMYSPVIHRNVIAGMLPLRDSTKPLLRRALDRHRRAMARLHDALEPASAGIPSVALIDRAHHIIASDNPVAAKAIFTNTEVLSAGDNALHTGRDSQDRRWSYATAPLLGNSVFVGFAMREASLFGPTYIHVGTDFILPFLMIALTWLAIWVVTEQQILRTRWIDYLQAHFRRLPHRPLCHPPAARRCAVGIPGAGRSARRHGRRHPGARQKPSRRREAEDRSHQGNPSPREEQSADRDEPAEPAGKSPHRSRGAGRAETGAHAHKRARVGASHSLRNRGTETSSI